MGYGQRFVFPLSFLFFLFDFLGGIEELIFGDFSIIMYSRLHLVPLLLVRRLLSFLRCSGRVLRWIGGGIRLVFRVVRGRLVLGIRLVRGSILARGLGSFIESLFDRFVGCVPDDASIPFFCAVILNITLYVLLYHDWEYS